MVSARTPPCRDCSFYPCRPKSQAVVSERRLKVPGARSMQTLDVSFAPQTRRDANGALKPPV